MRVVVQRVLEASVTVAGELAGHIEHGLLLLVGFGHGDGEREIEWMAHRIAGLRIFGDADGQMNATLADVGGGLLVVPQFTLLADCHKGRRPSFTGALGPSEARPLFERFVALLQERAGNVGVGRFGAAMHVHLVNDGPVTLVIDREARPGRASLSPEPTPPATSSRRPRSP